MKRAALGLLCLALSSCGTTALERKEMSIQAALDAAYLACQTGLNDPAVTWDVGAREYCLRIVNAEAPCGPR